MRTRPNLFIVCEEITQIGEPVSTKAETVMLFTKVGKIGMSRVGGERSAKVLTVATWRVGVAVICLFKFRACRRLGERAGEGVTLAGGCDKGGG